MRDDVLFQLSGEMTRRFGIVRRGGRRRRGLGAAVSALVHPVTRLLADPTNVAKRQLLRTSCHRESRGTTRRSLSRRRLSYGHWAAAHGRASSERGDQAVLVAAGVAVFAAAGGLPTPAGRPHTGIDMLELAITERAPLRGAKFRAPLAPVEIQMLAPAGGAGAAAAGLGEVSARNLIKNTARPRSGA